MKIVVTAVLAISALLFLAPAEVEAQTNGRGGPRVIQLEEFRIEGEVQKPNAFYILNRSNLGYEVLDLRTSFLREIIRSVDRQPF